MQSITLATKGLIVNTNSQLINKIAINQKIYVFGYLHS